MQRKGLSWAPQGWPGQVARREGAGRGSEVVWNVEGRHSSVRRGEAAEFGKWDLWEVRW